MSRWIPLVMLKVAVIMDVWVSSAGGTKILAAWGWGAGVGRREISFSLGFITHFEFCIRFMHYLIKIRN